MSAVRSDAPSCRLHSGNFTFTDALQNGADLRFVDSDNKTPLPFHVERFDATTGIAAAWVSVPNLNGGEKRTIWLYFGNKSAPVGADEKGTFDPDTMAAWHFAEKPGQPSADSTANANGAKAAPAGIMMAASLAALPASRGRARSRSPRPARSPCRPVRPLRSPRG